MMVTLLNPSNALLAVARGGGLERKLLGKWGSAHQHSPPSQCDKLSNYTDKCETKHISLQLTVSSVSCFLLAHPPSLSTLPVASRPSPSLTYNTNSATSNMAGGIKKPVNVFRLKDLGEPKEIFNWRLWLAVLAFGLMGAARGVDEGLIGGAFNSKNFQNSINYKSYSVQEQTNIKANVSAMVQIGSVGGALL
jgi:hypothetical protein